MGRQSQVGLLLGFLYVILCFDLDLERIMLHIKLYATVVLLTYQILVMVKNVAKSALV